MGESQTSLLSALKLDEYPLNNQFLLVEELNNADGSFLLSSIIKDQIDKSFNVILVLCHNSIGHFQAISLKLGYNLMLLKESGRVIVFDVFTDIVKNLFNKEQLLKELYLDIKKQYEKWENSEGICVILENIGNLLLIDVKEIYTFVVYIKALILKRKNCNFVCSVHNFPESLNFDKLTVAVKHFADISVTLKDLSTGRANDITGYMIVTRLGQNFKTYVYKYQFKLYDKSIKVFPPGSHNM